MLTVQIAAFVTGSEQCSNSSGMDGKVLIDIATSTALRNFYSCST